MNEKWQTSSESVILSGAHRSRRIRGFSGTAFFHGAIRFEGGRMERKEILDVLHANVDKDLRITFADGIVQSVKIDSVDDEGFLHSGPEGKNPQGFWTRFEDITLIEGKISD